MADVFVTMDADGDSSSKCREARRRRIEMRRLSSVAGDTEQMTEKAGGSGTKREAEPSDSDSAEGKRRRSSSPSPSSGGRVGGEVPPAIASGSDPDLMIRFGSVSLSGRSREMEDAVSLRPWFFRPIAGTPLHFFAVFDGHGGSHVSALCRERMHVLLAEELTRLSTAEQEDEEALRAAVRRCFGLMDELALAACACGSVGGPPCGCDRSGFESEIVGSTAVVAVLSWDRLLVANVGDSRAVLRRGGRSVALSDDHKPDRPDELARIEAAGGRVIYVNGARVSGILAMSRAIGLLFSTLILVLLAFLNYYPT